MKYDDLGFREAPAHESALEPAPSFRGVVAPAGPREDDVNRARHAHQIVEAARLKTWNHDRHAYAEERCRREAEIRFLRSELRAVEDELSALRENPDVGDVLGRGTGSLLGGGVGLLASKELLPKKHRPMAMALVLCATGVSARVQAGRGLDGERRRMEARARQLRRDLEIAERPLPPAPQHGVPSATAWTYADDDWPPRGSR